MRLSTIQLLIFYVLVCGLFVSCNQNSNVVSESALAVQTPPVLSKQNANTVEKEIKYYSPSDTCQKIEIDNERLLCEAIIKDQNLTDQELFSEFVYARQWIDLNHDGRKEVIVWSPTEQLGGSSGYPIIIFSQTEDGYEKLWEIDQAWTPIFALKSKSHGWSDVAFSYGGGGVNWHYEIIRHNGNSYNFYKRQKNQPEGELLIDKDWNQSVFGPIPKSK